ncbi:hypothetical protein D2E26_1355 [Bifidobacterium dolichotidis]|uniref:DUF4190 domain-containing protein n=1 Tax=Bifidobacterium dolichotidis TaxID=2306976 RepID=A0A430FP11_9BIFI|nr:MFS transporter [Bifidobacterium dolichotidis]RSX54555.1 hypothetical protein D2E26_1355 [Bifidobacterium dolichotidis]
MTFPDNNMPPSNRPNMNNEVPTQNVMQGYSQINAQATGVYALGTQPTMPIPVPVKKPKSKLALIGLIISSLGLAVSWIPVINLLGVVLALAGLALCIVGLVSTRRGKTAGKSLAIVGASIAAAALVIAPVIGSIAVIESNKDLDNGAVYQFDSGLTSSTPGTKYQGSGRLATTYVNIESIKTAPTEYGPRALVRIAWQNAASKAQNLSDVVDIRVSQNGKNLQLIKNKSEQQANDELAPTQNDVQDYLFELEDIHSDVTVECDAIDPAFSHDTVTQTFSLDEDGPKKHVEDEIDRMFRKVALESLLKNLPSLLF